MDKQAWKRFWKNLWADIQDTTDRVWESVNATVSRRLMKVAHGRRPLIVVLISHLLALLLGVLI